MRNKIVAIIGLAAIAVGVAYAALRGQRSSSLFPGMDVARYRFRVASPTPAETAIAALENRTHRPDPNAFDLAELSTLYWQQGHRSGDATWYDKAEAAAKQSMKLLEAPNLQAKLNLAKVADARHEFGEAIRIAEELRRENPSPGALAVLASAYLALGDLKEAARFADEGVDARPDSGAYLMRALVLEAQGRDAEAAFDFQRAVAVEDF